ncbi:cell division protein FtsH [Mycoplasmopsis canis UFG4]|uniref:ATP-dependent zinc metalloprotease FtsH n=1 Tax=Mycoplasmopsis canis UFG4 TaxID=1131455 RepID=I1A7G2_9BACT|nr:ATP-dependent zinc metalloprotease FtsH [Mycoplasmopsis canis]AKF41495.1 cell division protein FtsH [Mycoplasmopsis canis]EIE42263.1 cell division protein FtsH [Mycoplasmopsis canis UFG1]EIE42433.1 cell division protein FtsH [Mycoplasmopsis canis UFG4]
MKNKKTIIWLSIIVLVIIGLILYFTLFSKTTAHDLSISELASKIESAGSDTKDPEYFKFIKFNPFKNEISSGYISGHESKEYITYGKLGEVLGLLKNNENSNTILNALKSSTSGEEGQLWSVGAPEQSIVTSILISLIPTFLIVIVLWLLYRSQSKMMNGQGGVFGDKSPAQIIKSDKKFADVAGNKEPIEEISEIVDYLKNPKRYEEAGARMPRGILLGGPPGTGKTLLAKATAGEANVPFYFVSASSFVELFVGMGAKRVRQVISEARKNSPAIVFIDELDAIGRTRGSGIGGGHDEREQTLNQLLVEMDGIKENSGLLFIAATNRTDVLDPALTRPGRFDRVITVGLPDIKEREEILKLHAKGKRFSSDVIFSNIAKRTPGFSGAQLENVINESVLLTVRERSQVITLEIIDEAIDRVMSGPAKKSRTITKEELTSVAYHEAGHAVVGIKVPGGNKVQKITIIPRGQAGGYNLMMPEQEKYNYSKKELLATIASFMGGRAAEEIIYGEDNISTGASDDINKATSIARRMVTEFGMSDLGPIKYHEESGSPFLGKTLATSSSISNQISHEIDLEVRKIILEAKNIAIKVINENRTLLELIKTLLLEKETIISEEIDYIAQNLQLPPKQEIIKEKEQEIDLESLISMTEKQEENKV